MEFHLKIFLGTLSKSFTGDNAHCLIQDGVKLAVSEKIRGLRLCVDEQQYELERMTRLLETKEKQILQLEGKIITFDHKDLDEKVNAMAHQIHIELNNIVVKTAFAFLGLMCLLTQTMSLLCNISYNIN